MPQARDEAGNIWEIDAAGNPVRMVQPATPSVGRVFTLPTSPKEARQESRQNEADARARDAERRANAAEQRAQADFASKNTMVAPPGDITKTGDDYLATLPPSLAAQVKAMSDGRRAFPTGAALRSPSVQELVAAASQYDPTLDAANAATRVATRKDFTSGKSAQNITAMNTALGHLGTLAKSANGLENRSFPLWNSLANTAESATGDPRVSNFRLARDAVANELMKVFRGTGGSLQEVQEWQHAIDSSDSPEQLHAAITKATELLQSRLEAVGDQYNRGMGKSGDPIQLLSPHAQRAFDAIRSSHDLADIVAASAAQHADNELPGPPTGGGDKPPPNDPSPPDMPPENGDRFVATGSRRTTYDPRTSSQIDSLISAGASKAMVDAVLKKQGFPIVSGAEWKSIQDWRAGPGKGKKYTGANISRTDDLSLAQRAAGSAPAALAAHLANAGTAGLVGAAAGEQGQGALDAMGTLHPDASVTGDVLGGITGAMGLEGAVASRAPAALAKYAPRVADALYGGSLGFNTAKEGEGLQGAATGALTGAIGGAVGQRVMGGVGRAVRGVSDPAVQMLREAGIPLTVGQAVGNSGLLGKGIRSAEDRLAGFWGAGDAVKARQREGVEAFANRMSNDAVAPIGGSAEGYGEPMVNDILQQGSDAYTNATAGAHVPLDPQFATDMAGVRALGSQLPDDLAARFGKAIDNRVAPVEGQGFLTGDTFQQASRGFKSYRAEATKPGFEQDYRDAISQGMDALKGQMNRGGGQDVVDNLAKADQAWKQIKIIQKATQAARNGARSGEVGLPMPSQFNDAATATANKFGGSRFNGDLIDAGQRVLPNKVPDSGTAGRIGFGTMLGAGATIGAGGGALTGDTGAGAATGLGLTLMLAAGGSRPAQHALVTLLADRPDAARKIGETIARNAGIGGWTGAGALTPLFIGN